MKYPLLYQINTRVYLYERGAELGRPATLDDVPDELLDWTSSHGFEWVWLLGMWQTGEEGRRISLTNPELGRAYNHELPGWSDEDVVGSPFAVQEYTVKREFGGEAALQRLRTRMQRRGLKLLLDFVPNHTAPDHPWVRNHPEYYIHGTEEDLAREPQNYRWVDNGNNRWVAAYGRDPYFSGWADTLQLNYQRADVREAMTRQLIEIANKCDGVRCDMAMLVQPEVFMRTWGDRSPDSAEFAYNPFWQHAIAAVKDAHPGFMFIAEVYWDMEWELQQQGFDFTYDKRLYDRLLHDSPRSVHDHLLADPTYQDHSLRFLENHDEPRAAAEFPDFRQHRAAALVTFFTPGLRFFHEGQFEGRKVHASMHLRRRPDEPPNEEIRQFYEVLLNALHRPAVHEGRWKLLETRPAWDGNDSWQNFIAWSWEHESGMLLAVVNYNDFPAQCYVRLDMPSLEGVQAQLTDMLSEAGYERDGTALNESGLYLDMPGFGYHLFEVAGAVRAAPGRSRKRKAEVAAASA